MRAPQARTSSRAGLVRAALVLGALALAVVGVRALRATSAREPTTLHARAPVSVHDSSVPSSNRATLLAMPERQELEVPQPLPAEAQLPASPLAQDAPDEKGASSAGVEPSTPSRELASVDGRLRAADGAGLVDVAVRLIEGETQQVHTTRSGADGLFHFPGVAVGPVALTMGEGEKPFLPPVDALAQAPRTLLEDIVLPELGTLEVVVLDATGQPVAGASVECLGRLRGSALATTDADGRARFEHIPAGEARAFARHPSLGRGNRSFAFVPHSAERFEIQLLTAAPR